MATLAEWLIVGAFVGGVIVYKRWKRASYPDRIVEMWSALDTQADLYRHRNKDPATADQLAAHAANLKHAQLLVNASNDAVAQDWPKVRHTVSHLSSEDGLKSAGLYYTDRREDIKAALFDLLGRLDKKEGRARRT